jgi:hypothetical protein
MGVESSGDTESNISEPKITILDACLSYIKYSMTNRDKLYVQDATCARFDLPTIKRSHEIIVKYCEPNQPYKYKGPNKSTPREKAIAAFDQIYTKLRGLDASGCTPIIACPSDELHVILSMNGHCDHKALEQRFQKIESDVSQINVMEKGLNDLKATVLALMTNPISAPVVSCIPPIIKDRLINTDSQSPTRSRLSSASSVKRLRSDGDDSSDNSDIEFIIPKNHIKQANRREKRQKLANGTKSYSAAVKSSAPKPTPNRREAVWGKSSEVSCSGFTGSIPDAFIFNCEGNPDEQKVREHLDSKNINTSKIELMSHKDSYKRSFKITLVSYEDYDRLLSGEHLPRGVGVKKFIRPRAIQLWGNSDASFMNSAARDTNNMKMISAFNSFSDNELRHVSKVNSKSVVNASGTVSNDITLNTNMPINNKD